MASERLKWWACAWEQVDFKTAILHVRRAKNGTPATHPLSGREMRELRRHQRESPSSPFVFVSERGAPLSAPGFSRMVERAVAMADLGIKAHAHMLRHTCGYKLANDGDAPHRDYRGFAEASAPSLKRTQGRSCRRSILPSAQCERFRLLLVLKSCIAALAPQGLSKLTRWKRRLNDAESLGTTSIL
jgi:hypothetical protein